MLVSGEIHHTMIPFANGFLWYVLLLYFVLLRILTELNSFTIEIITLLVAIDQAEFENFHRFHHCSLCISIYQFSITVFSFFILLLLFLLSFIDNIFCILHTCINCIKNCLGCCLLFMLRIRNYFHHPFIACMWQGTFDSWFVIAISVLCFFFHFLFGFRMKIVRKKCTNALCVMHYVRINIGQRLMFVLKIVRCFILNRSFRFSIHTYFTEDKEKNKKRNILNEKMIKFLLLHKLCITNGQKRIPM